MKKLLFLCFFLLLFVVDGMAQSQPDTIIVYTIKTGKIDTILPVIYNSTDTFAITSSNIGALGNVTPLSQTPPTTNLFTNANYNDLSKASNTFNLSNYPIRTATALRYYNLDTAKTSCSGMLVSSNFVLSAAHCVYNYANQSFSNFDSLRISPVFNNGQEAINIPASYAKRIYIFKTYYDKKAFDDIALIELDDHIGLQTGWVGIGYSTNFANFQNKVFHKFSYPARAHPFNPARVYNGDTLYYNYGFIDFMNPSYVVTSPDAVGIPGQSGSSFLYTDNNQYYSVGVFNFSSYYRHYAITNKVFYQFQNILENTPMSVKEYGSSQTNALLWPNPFTDVINVQIGKTGNYVFSLYNSTGEKILNERFYGNYKSFSLNDLSQGIYFVRIENNTAVISTGKFIKH